MQLEAQWALRSKRPGERRDYSILAMSAGPWSDEDCTRAIVQHFPAAPPTARSGGPGAPPCVAFFPTPESLEAFVGVSVLYLTGETDHDGRDIAPTLFIRIRFAELAVANVDYRSIVSALLPLIGRPLAQAPLTVTARPVDVKAATERIETVGFDRVAAAAAFLLDGAVLLNSAGNLPIDERVDCLDAITDLLAYGYRADLACATWGDNIGRAIRLNFGFEPHAGQRVLTWLRDRPIEPPSAGLAGEYFALLSQLRSRHGLAEVVRHLAGKTEPERFSAPERALELLRELDRPFWVSQAARDGRAKPAEVRAIVAGGRPMTLLPAEWLDLIRFLVLLADPKDLPAIGRHWSPELLPVVAGLCARRLSMTGDDRLVGDYLHLLKARGEQIPFLLAVLKALPDGARGMGDSPALIVSLLRACLVVPVPPSWLPVRERLATQPGLAVELLAQESEAGDLSRLRALLAWLDGADGTLSALVAPWRLLLTGLAGSNLEAHDLKALAEFGISGLLAFVESAKRLKRLDMALPALTRWLVASLQTATLAQRQRWAAALGEADAWKRADIRCRVEIDLLTMLVGGQLSATLTDRLLGPEDQGTSYLEAFSAVVQSPDFDAVRVDLAARLAAYVDGQAWASPTALGGRTLRLLHVAMASTGGTGAAVLSPGPALPLLEAVVRGVAAGPDLLETVEYRQLWSALVMREPRLSAQTALIALRRALRPRMDTLEVARYCADALVRRASPADVLRAVGEQASVSAPDIIHSLLEATRSELALLGVEPQRAWDTYFDLVKQVLAGSLGREAGRAYRAWLADQSPVALYAWSGLFELVRDDVNPAHMPAIQHSADILQSASRLGAIGRASQALRGWLPRAGGDDASEPRGPTRRR